MKSWCTQGKEGWPASGCFENGLGFSAEGPKDMINKELFPKAQGAVSLFFGCAKKSPFFAAFILSEFALAIFLSGPISLLFWGSFFIDAGTFLGTVDAVPPQVSDGWSFTKGFGIALLVYGVLLLLGTA